MVDGNSRERIIRGKKGFVFLAGSIVINTRRRKKDSRTEQGKNEYGYRGSGGAMDQVRFFKFRFSFFYFCSIAINSIILDLIVFLFRIYM